MDQTIVPEQLPRANVQSKRPESNVSTPGIGILVEWRVVYPKASRASMSQSARLSRSKEDLGAGLSGQRQRAAPVRRGVRLALVSVHT